MSNILAEKILVLGVDGMDPRLTKKYVGLGKMPNVQKLIEKGSAREDLVMLGAQPTSINTIVNRIDWEYGAPSKEITPNLFVQACI